MNTKTNKSYSSQTIISLKQLTLAINYIYLFQQINII